MSAPPTRCCAPATSGRCSNAPAPYSQSRYIGVVEIAACNHPKHQAALRSLPDFQRRAGVCGADDCGKAAESGLCPEHRQLYRRHGINIRALLAQEAPMTEPITPPAAPKESGGVGAPPSPEAVEAFLLAPKPAAEVTGADSEPPHPLETRRDALVVRLHIAGFTEGRRPTKNLRRFHHDPKVIVLIPDGHPCEVEGDFATLLDKAEEQCARVERATAPPATVEEFLRDMESGDGEPSEGDVVDAPLFVGGTDAAPELVARWGQVHTAPVQPMSADLDGLAAIAAIAARGQQPTAPGSTVAELQQQLAAERARADLLDAEAVSQRQRAEAVEAQLRAIAEALDPEDAPAFDANDQPIPLPVRVQTALMPDPIGKSELEQRITKALDRYDAPKGFGSLGQASPYGRVLLTARENKQLKADKAALQGIIDDAEWIVHHCGSYGATASLADRILRLLPVERQRAVLELKRSEANIEVLRINARFLNPPPPGRLEEYEAAVATLDARIAALDAEKVQE